MKQTVKLLALIILAFSSSAPTQAAEPLTGIYVAVRDFIVTVSPVDEESKNAENSDLYQRSDIDGEWTNLGACEKISLPNGDVRFVKTVSVATDGTYFYTSRPVVSGQVQRAPHTDSPPQATVVVDTLAPIVDLLSPSEAAEITAGDTVNLVWRAKDENLAERPVNLAWSRDGGDSWQIMADNVVSEGDMNWTIPETADGPTLFRALAVDKAGNIGTALRNTDIAALPIPEPQKKPETIVTRDTPSEPEKKVVYDRNKSWLYYLMAINQMRQNKPKEALQYYWLSVKYDPEFVDAWADIALAYVDLGAYRSAREIVERTRKMDPERIDLMHLMGETYHAEGMTKLTEAKSPGDRMQAKEMIDQAVAWYGMALETASEEWRLAEQAPSYYRLGEICYFVNMDKDGARAYWMKILDLHSPTPNADLIIWASPEEKDSARRNYQRYTYQRVSLETWQNWARGYILQMDEWERRGIADMMPANRINRTGLTAADAAACGDFAPGRPDGRSLFSLPTQFGTEASVPVSTGTAYGTGRKQRPVTDGYSFYAPKEPNGYSTMAPPKKGPGRNKRSVFSGGPDIPEPVPADPYAFPLGNRKSAAWNESTPYGNKPVENW